MEVYNGMARERLCELLEKIRGVRAAILGDLCLDVYWLADMKRSELSLETPHFPLPVVEERMSPGGGGNAAANLAALEPMKVFAVGVTGEDWRRAELLKLLGARGIDTAHVNSVPGIVTNAYCKPLRAGISETIYEDPRLDFCNYEPLGAEAEDAVIASLDAVVRDVDVLCVSDQHAFGVCTPRVRGHILTLARGGLTIVVDSRYNIDAYSRAILKPNEKECASAIGAACLEKLDDYEEAALKLSHKCGSEVIMTIGAQGAIYTDGSGATHIPARKVNGEIDIVGAGDTFMSGFSLALAAGAARPEAACLAALCSEVTIRKIGCTGDATPEEALAHYDHLPAPYVPSGGHR